jgi:hypothetical protein
VTGIPPAADAARNNAEWCHVLCGAHGIRGTFHPGAWTAPTRTPRFYPDAVTFDPALAAANVLPFVDAGPGCSIKDSFATLDLATAGFRVLFDATWIGRPAATIAEYAPWPRVTDADALHDWQRAWARPDPPTGLFPPALLDEPDVIMVGGETDGAVLNRAAGCVGVTNVFTRAGGLDGAWRAVLATAAEHFPGLPLVGYETDDALAAAQRNGFIALGPLRVWMKD